MALFSMTGFGRGEFSGQGHKVTVELSSVNRKQFDCSVSMPRELVCCEARLQKAVSSQIKRGCVKGIITVERDAADNPECAGIDLAAAQQQIGAMRRAAQKLGLADDLTLSSLFKMPGLLRSSLALEAPELIWPVVEKAVGQALGKLLEMRGHEGNVLEKDIRKRLKNLQKICAQIAKIAPKVPGSYKQTLHQRLAKLLENESLVDKDALAREVALFADRCDISEELTRLKSHFNQTEMMLETGGVCGRTLDFICQEMFREINTTGSKAVNADISKLVIDFKAGLEAIREQVQNIE